MTRRLTFVIAMAVLVAATGLVRMGAQGRGRAEPPPEMPPHLVYLPMDVAERMLEDAGITSDVVYDLGCGDGRIAILG